MLILGIESSCDETGVALVDTEHGLLADAVHTQAAMHADYGGVVPELASRDHIRRVLPLTDRILQQTGKRKEDIDLIAYTAGPGLAGALLVGSAVAQAVGFAWNKPVYPIHHLEGHLLSPLLGEDKPVLEKGKPFVALLVSGGHTMLLQVNGVGHYSLLGETVDDAAGEAFDKTAKLLGLGYPGGPLLAQLATQGDAKRFELPRPMLHSGDAMFSFSGLKTAVLTQLKKLEPLTEQDRADLAASTQAAIVDVLVRKCLFALKQTGAKQLVIAGGVGANRLLRDTLNTEAAQRKFKVFYPPLSLCTDNGAMIAWAAALRVNAGLPPMQPPDQSAHMHPLEPGAFTVHPRWPLMA